MAYSLVFANHPGKQVPNENTLKELCFYMIEYAIGVQLKCNCNVMKKKNWQIVIGNENYKFLIFEFH